MATLMSKVGIIQQKQEDVESSHMVQEKGHDDNDEGLGTLVALTESTQAFLEAAFSSMLANADHKKQIEYIGVPDCDSIQCPKLDHPVIQAIVPNDVIKVDGYLSCLHQYVWMRWCSLQQP